MNKFTNFLEELNEDELDLLEQDLKSGHIEKYIERKKEFFKIKDKICAVCGNAVEADCFVLIFGEPSIRKKAHFCGVDCLEYFIHNFIKDKNKKIKKENSFLRKNAT